MPNRRSYTREFKASVVLALLSGSKSRVELCHEHQIAPQLLTRWKRDFIQSAHALLLDPASEAQRKRLAELDAVIDRLLTELEAARKALEGLQSTQSEGDRSGSA